MRLQSLSSTSLGPVLSLILTLQCSIRLYTTFSFSGSAPCHGMVPLYDISECPEIHKN